MVWLPRDLGQVVFEDVGGQVLVFVLSASQLLPGKLPALIVGHPDTPNGLGRPSCCDQLVKSASVPCPFGLRLTPSSSSFRKARREHVRLRDGRMVHAGVASAGAEAVRQSFRRRTEAAAGQQACGAAASESSRKAIRRRETMIAL